MIDWEPYWLEARTVWGDCADQAWYVINGRAMWVEPVIEMGKSGVSISDLPHMVTAVQRIMDEHRIRPESIMSVVGFVSLVVTATNCHPGLTISIFRAARSVEQ